MDYVVSPNASIEGINQIGEKSYIGPYSTVKNLILGDNSKLLKFNNVYDCKIGKDCKIGAFVEIQGNSTIGNNVTISSHSFICSLVEIQDNAWIGHHVVTINDIYPPSMKRTGTSVEWKPTLIGKNVIIGSNTTLFPVSIGENSIIGAGSVVRKNVPSNEVWAGNPARFICNKNKLFDNQKRESSNHKLQNNIQYGTNKMIKLNDLHLENNSISQEIDSAISSVIYSSRFIGGPKIKEFEDKFANYCHKTHCIGTSSGSTALYVALKCLGIKKGDEVIIPVNTFISTASSVTLTGAKPVFVDINELDGLIDLKQMEGKINDNTKAIIPVHLYGNVCEMDKILEIAAKNKLQVIEDCAQAHGSEYKSQKVPIGDLGCFSFFPSKNLGAFGDAGAIVTSDEDFAEKCRKFINHGRKDKYKHDSEGFNFRFDALQAAILNVKIKYLDSWLEMRRIKANKYLSSGLKSFNISQTVKHSHYVYPIRVEKRDELIEKLKEKNIESVIHYPIPLHLQPCFSYLGHKIGDFPIAEKISKEVLSIPIHPFLSDEDQEKIIEIIKENINSIKKY